MKFIRVDKAENTVSINDTPIEYQRLGGRRLTSTFVNTEVPPTCDPLGPENKLIFRFACLTTHRDLPQLA